MSGDKMMSIPSYIGAGLLDSETLAHDCCIIYVTQYFCIQDDPGGSTFTQLSYGYWTFARAWIESERFRATHPEVKVLPTYHAFNLADPAQREAFGIKRELMAAEAREFLQ